MSYLTFPPTKNGLYFQDTHCDSINVFTRLTQNRTDCATTPGRLCLKPNSVFISTKSIDGYCTNRAWMRMWAVEMQGTREVCHPFAKRRVPLRKLWLIGHNVCITPCALSMCSAHVSLLQAFLRSENYGALSLVGLGLLQLEEAVVHTHGCRFLVASVKGSRCKSSQSIANAVSGFCSDAVAVICYDFAGLLEHAPRAQQLVCKEWSQAMMGVSLTEFSWGWSCGQCLGRRGCFPALIFFT